MSDVDGVASPPMSTLQSEHGPGCFIAVVGPSGAGKDTMLRLASDELRDDPRIVFARRVVTRNAVSHVEDHDEMDRDRFEHALASGAFCLSWPAHGLWYGLPRALEVDLASQRSVVANVSRRALSDAAARFGRLVVVEITAPAEILIERIIARGRETREEAAARVARQVEWAIPPACKAYHRIVNDGAPEIAAAAFVDLIRRNSVI